MTAGWLAFDENTRRELSRIERAGIDRFGEPLRIVVADGPILAELARAPMRAPQLAARLNVRRFALAIALEALIVRALVHRDDEAFFWRAA